MQKGRKSVTWSRESTPVATICNFCMGTVYFILYNHYLIFYCYNIWGLKYLTQNDTISDFQLKLQFDDSLTRTFEYPSEISLSEDSPSSPAAAKDAAHAPQLAESAHHAPLAANTHIGTKLFETSLQTAKLYSSILHIQQYQNGRNLKHQNHVFSLRV